MRDVFLWAGVGALGGCGAVSRFLVQSAVARRVPGPFPTGTLVVNVSGSLLLGLLAGLALHGDALLLAGTAVLGSYTTFSTWMLESYRLVDTRSWAWLAAYTTLSLALGLGGVMLGRALGELL